MATATPTPTSRPATDHGRDTRRTVLAALFVAYLGLLVWLVLWKLEVPWVGGSWRRTVKLVPFVATARAGASQPPEVVANVLLFVPFGVYLGLLAPVWRWWRTAAVVAATSLGLEVTQYVLAVGSTDLTDVVANTAGGVVGLAVVALVRGRLGARTTTVLVQACAVGTVLALLAAAAVAASPLRYQPPGGGMRDVHVPRSGELPTPGPRG
ncbi:VanZ family protein [Cellulomonas sp.]|uniref:VanZ family protein n=1 Tax=Cellulomonas sp. TaxID=40001 RepID=UPI001B0A5E08|nr:VanZ family protein [Cellulomonas sp.]MBO9555023.1 VanZ family protein [Cellulomonas sp.]